VKPTVIDGESAAAVLCINFDETFAETDIAPAVILLCLHGRCDDGIDSHDRYNKERTAGFERFDRLVEKRTLVVDCVPQSQCRGENRQPIEMQFENIKVTEIPAFYQRFVRENMIRNSASTMLC